MPVIVIINPLINKLKNASNEKKYQKALIERDAKEKAFHEKYNSTLRAKVTKNKQLITEYEQNIAEAEAIRDCYVDAYYPEYRNALTSKSIMDTLRKIYF